ncbi:MAG TPA: flagellin [Beijerinckiaceae bacterium]|nr:flagellin [Beijerinckiaceae bacterium]
MSSVSFSKAVRQNLISLQETAEKISVAQNRLSTGKKVNSALDNATNFFTAAGLNSRANDLSLLLDGISNAVKTVDAANNGITSITRLVESAQSTARQALSDKSSASYNSLEGAATINLTGSTGTTAKDQGMNQTLANVGFADGDTFSLSTTKNGVTKSFSYDLTTVGTKKVSDLVAAINASGVATAEVTDAGKLKISGAADEQVALQLNSADGNTTAGNADVATGLGFTQSTGGTTTVTNAEGAANGDRDSTLITLAAGTASVNRAALVTQYNEILKQVNKLADDASFNGVNLLKGGVGVLKVAFNEKVGSAKNELSVDGIDLTKTGLSLSDATTLDDSEATNKLTELTNALTKLRTSTSTFGSNLAIIQSRQDFTKATINTLKAGADNLVLADNNEEGATLLALQTRQQLASTALSLSNQQDQAVLRLFG